jgi:hypothetical protein
MGVFPLIAPSSIYTCAGFIDAGDATQIPLKVGRLSEVQHHNQGGHGVQAGSGGDAQNFGQILGLEHSSHGQNFLANLLGLDHNSHNHGSHGQHGGGGEGQVHHLPSQSAGWNSALQAVKLTDALQGINVTPNFLFLLLFAGFTTWLGVVYWIRHHEPLANSVLGTHTAHSATAAADRRIIDGTKNACSFRTTTHSGEIYLPGSANAEVAPMQPPPVPPTPYPLPQPVQLDTSAYGMPNASTEPYQPQYAPPVNTTGNFYTMPDVSASGARVKMIVNR